MKRIATLTMNPSIDVSASVEHVIAGQKLRCKPSRYEPGGGGINVSRAITRLGGSSTALYTAGGTFGIMLQDLLYEEVSPHVSIPVKESTRLNFSILEGSNNRQFRFGMPGPVLVKEEWDRCLGALKYLDPKPDYVVASGSLPPGVPEDFYAQLAGFASESGIRLIVDTSGEPLRLASEAGVFLLKPNMREMQSIANHEIKNEQQLEETAWKLIERGCSKIIIISLGAGGALVVSKDGYEHVRAPAVPIRSRIGAGDSMVAGIVLSLAKGKSLYNAACFGVAAGAAAVMSPGTELCSREETEQLYSQIIAKKNEE